jgi:hypothetical protein
VISLFLVSGGVTHVRLLSAGLSKASCQSHKFFGSSNRERRIPRDTFCNLARILPARQGTIFRKKQQYKSSELVEIIVDWLHADGGKRNG